MDNHGEEQSGNKEKSMGKGMIYIGWLFALGVLTMSFGRWESFQDNPNQSLSNQTSNGIREVTLDANRQHHYLANGKINGNTVTFLLDTGATDVVIPQTLAKKLGLRAGAKGYATTANGNVEIRYTEIETLSLGSIELRSVKASINPGMGGKEILLGMSALKQVELIQKNNQLTLRQY
ncbi:MAG: retropepsin-like aspartic protease family protein [Cellvibrionaceae bacterium]